MKKILLLLAFTFVVVKMQLSAVERTDSVRESISNFAKIEEKQVSEVDKLKKMFKKGKSSGQLKAMYSSAPDLNEPYVTAIGGILKYELAEYRGFNAGVAAYISYDLAFASGEGIKSDSELSSSEGRYVDIGEVYLNYKYSDFSLRAGRQTLDTPLADRDDMRMIQNSFEAYILRYNYEGVKFMAGNFQRWQGYDAGLDNSWVNTGTYGTNFAGVTYMDGFEFNTWYYNITGMTNAAYFDLGIEYQLNSAVLLHTMVQYLNQSEIDDSGVAASIYGIIGEIVVNGLGFNLSINKAERFEGKQSFSGFGGGALFTNMNTMIMDEITQDKEVLSYVAGISYAYEEFHSLYAYGDFSGSEDSSGTQAHIVEQNVGLGYTVNNEFVVGLVLARQDDLLNSSNSWNHAQVRLNYNFK